MKPNLQAVDQLEVTSQALRGGKLGEFALDIGQAVIHWTASSAMDEISAAFFPRFAHSRHSHHQFGAFASIEPDPPTIDPQAA